VNLLAALLLGFAAQRAMAVDVPGSGGRARVGGYLDGLAVVETDEDSPDQDPQGLMDLFAEGSAARWLRGRFEIRSRVGGPFVGGHPGYFNFVHEFQNYTTPSLEFTEAYADVLLSKADFRIGIQRFAWGKLDGIPPTDVINPRSYHDPVVEDLEERKLGIPALSATYYLPDVPKLELSSLRTTLIWVPWAVPSRLALLEERWFPRSLELGGTVFVPKIGRVPVTFGTGNHRPPDGFTDGGIAGRLGGTWRDVDWDVYHYTGPETGPNADLAAFVGSPGPDQLLVDGTLRQAHDTMHMTGADAAATFGGLTMRVEGAYFIDRPYLRVASDLIAETIDRVDVTRLATKLAMSPPGTRVPVAIGDLFPSQDSVEWGIGADYLWKGFQPLVQVNQVIITDHAPRLIIANPETRFTAVLRKRLMSDRLELEVRSVYAVDRDWWFAFPRVSYLIRDNFRVRVGYLAIGGARQSLIGQFRDNDEVVFQARWSF
jgi:hypothetical protein